MSAIEQDIIEVDPDTKEMLKVLVNVVRSLVVFTMRDVWTCCCGRILAILLDCRLSSHSRLGLLSQDQVDDD